MADIITCRNDNYESWLGASSLVVMEKSVEENADAYWLIGIFGNANVGLVYAQ